jgi:hypothetical protein
MKLFHYIYNIEKILNMFFEMLVMWLQNRVLFCIKPEKAKCIRVGTRKPSVHKSSIKTLSVYGAYSDIKQKCGEALPIGKSMKRKAQTSLAFG